ncbi:MAG: hypothetical protein HQL75_00365 [Magnetococcales bacterium]|nr:hypothetical protein [Magnetococcales bacterium]
MIFKMTVVASVDMQKLISVKAKSVMDAEFKYQKFLNARSQFTGATNDGFKFTYIHHISPVYKFDLARTEDGRFAGVVQANITMTLNVCKECTSEQDAWEKAEKQFIELKQADPFYDWEWKSWIAAEESSRYMMKHFYTEQDRVAA